jgi:hypothetical protein
VRCVPTHRARGARADRGEISRSVMLAQLTTRMRCSQCGKKVAEVVAVARPRPRGVPKNPH